MQSTGWKMSGAWIGSLGEFGKWIVLIVVVGILGLALVGVLLRRNVSVGFRWLATLNVTVPGPAEASAPIARVGKHPPGQDHPSRKMKARAPGKKRKGVA